MRRIALAEERLMASLTYEEMLCSDFRSLLRIRNNTSKAKSKHQDLTCSGERRSVASEFDMGKGRSETGSGAPSEVVRSTFDLF